MTPISRMCVLTLAFAAQLPVSPLHAQAGPASGAARPAGLPRGFSLGATFDHARFELGRNRTEWSGITVRGVEIEREKWTSEFSVGTVFNDRSEDPRFLSAELGLAHNAPIWGSHVLFRAGASSLLTFTGGEGLWVGGYGGIGVVGRLAGRLGFRADLTRRYLHVTGRYFMTVTVLSVGLTTIPRAAPTGTMP
jgi:hypothetical protein